jgi:2-polyprenyl-3-methyl-5-hydroxy-6-metoxy-1,4-benzoquinol methylase
MAWRERSRGMAINKCRVCGCEFFEEPLIRYRNMPAIAQFLPDAKTLEGDRGIDLTVYQCSGCGLAQLGSDPVFYFRQVIRAAAVSEEMKGFRMSQFNRFIQDFSLKGKKIIEIGCGRGEYLSIMQQCGGDVYGLEDSEESAAHCVRSGLNASKGFIESSAYKSDHAPFDAFFMLSFLEHLPDPNSTLRGIRNNLASDAVGLVEAPNFDMMVRNSLFSEFMADHLLYFTGDTLRTTLALNGFEVIECNEIWHDYIISAVVRKRGKPDLSYFYGREAQLKDEIEKYLRRFENRKVAIWGAGHQAFAIISLMNLAGKVRYVVDSAVFKQGKYTPATHIPIVPPEALETDPVEAVIIMAAGYSDEVARILRQRFDRNMEVAIVRDFGLEVA